MLRLTPVVKNLIIINAIVFLGGMLAPQVYFPECFGRPLDVISAYLSLFSVRNSDCFKPYQLFTYMFVHGGFMHIFFNMLTLAFVGPILETFWGPKRFTTFYLVTGIGAAVFTIFVNVVVHLGEFDMMVGASGAIYGLLMGFGMLFPNMEVMLLFPPIPIKAKYLVFLVGGLTFLMDTSGQVAHFTHLGGIVFAFIFIRLWRHQGGSSY